MGVTVVTPPTSDPISVDEALSHCRVTDAGAPDMVGYILQARKFAESYTRLRFMTQTLDCTFDTNKTYPVNYNSVGYGEAWSSWPLVLISGRGYWLPRIELPVSPVQSIVSVKYVDMNGSPQTLDPSQYAPKLDQTIGYIDPAYNVTWPPVRCQSGAITVRIVAGYQDGQFPEDLRHDMLSLIATYYDNRGILPLADQLAINSQFAGYRVEGFAW